MKDIELTMEVGEHVLVRKGVTFLGAIVRCSETSTLTSRRPYSATIPCVYRGWHTTFHVTAKEAEDWIWEKQKTLISQLESTTTPATQTSLPTT